MRAILLKSVVAMITIMIMPVPQWRSAAAGESFGGPVRIAPGYFTKSPNPGCIGEQHADPSAQCERVCTTIPASAKVQEVSYFLKEIYDQEFVPAQPGQEALPWAKFQPFTVNQYKDVQEVCAIVMNWSGDREREAQIKVTFFE